MNNLAKAIWTAAILALAAPVQAQDGNDSSTVYSQAGEISPGTRAPTRAELMQAIQTATPDRLFTILEYGERVECHECVPLLERLILEHGDHRVREIAAWWLRQRVFGFAAVHHEIRNVLATDSDPVRRARAAEALGEFMDSHGVPYLIQALGDQDARVRAAAVRGLGRINAPAGHQGIVQAFADSDATVREAAVAQVLRVNFFRNYDALMGLLADDTASVRRRAALALGTFGVTDAVPALAAMLHGDSEPLVRQAAAWALGKIGGGEATQALTAAAQAEQSARVIDAIEVAQRM